MSVRSMLLLLVLVPTLAVVALEIAGATSSFGDASRAGVIGADSRTLVRILHARSALLDERLPSEVIAAASRYHLSPSEAGAMLGMDVRGDLVRGRRAVDADPVLRSTATLQSDFARLQEMRRELDTASASFSAVDALFTTYTTDVDALWLHTMQRTLASRAVTGAPGRFALELTVFRQVYLGVAAGQDEAQATDALLSGPPTPAATTALLDAESRFATATAAFTDRLGPRATAAWHVYQHDPEVAAFAVTIGQAERAGLTGTPVPLAGDPSAVAAAMSSGVRRVEDLAAVADAAAADIVATATSAHAHALRGFAQDVGVAVAVTGVIVACTVLLANAMARPLLALAAAARRVGRGHLDETLLAPRGPRELAETIQAFDDVVGTLGGLHAKANALAAEDLGHPVLDQPLPGQPGHVVQDSVQRLTQQLRQRADERRQLVRSATRDALTGLLNRSAAFEALHRDLARARRHDSPLAVLFVDLDGLKPINDTFGHDAGDAALRATAGALRAATRDGDVVARLGGDEFVVATELREARDALALATRIRSEVASAPIEVGNRQVPLRCSVGVAMSLPEDTDPAALITRADRAMYEAKRSGGNGIALAASQPIGRQPVGRQPVGPQPAAAPPRQQTGDRPTPAA